MGRSFCLAAGISLAVIASASAQQRVWILPIHSRDGNWTFESSGGYPGTHGGGYYWGQGFDGVRRAWWRFNNDAPFVAGPGLTTTNPPDEPRLYKVETWRPPAHTNVYNVITVDPNNRDTPNWFRHPGVPWNGAFSTNTQWLDRRTEQGGQPNDFVQAGSGPQAPLAIADTDPQSTTFGYSQAVCAAGRTGTTVWLRRGSELYVQFNQGFYNASSEIAVSAIRITELNPVPTPLCGAAPFGGPLDLRCIGNNDPFYGVGKSPWWDALAAEPFGNGPYTMINEGDNTLAADGYMKPCSNTMYQSGDESQPDVAVPTALTPGLPVSGSYTAHLATGDVAFKLLYDGPAALKWDPGASSGDFAWNRVFSLNGTPGQQFIPGRYSALYLLTVKSGNNGQLVVTLKYSDATTEQYTTNLYDWFGQTGDAGSIAVGVNGDRRDAGGIGHKRLRGTDNQDENGYPSNGGDTNGAFMFVHPIPVASSKTLTGVDLAIQPDGRGFGGRVNVVGATLTPQPCNTPAFDVAGGGVNGDEPDGAVDLQDFGAFQLCYTDANPGQFDASACTCFDRDGNGVIDTADFNKFKNCFTGPTPGSPPAANCDQ